MCNIVKLIRAESKMVVPRGWQKGELGSCSSLGIKFQSRRWKSPRNLLYSTVIVVNNNVLFTLKFVKRAYHTLYVFVTIFKKKEKNMHRKAWWATIHEVAGLDMTWVTEHACTHMYSSLPRSKGLSHVLLLDRYFSEYCFVLSILWCFIIPYFVSKSFGSAF